MKKTILLLVVTISSLNYYSCNKDDDDGQTQKNQFEIAGTAFELGQGILEYQGKHGDSIHYGYSMDLLSSSILFESRENYNDDNWPNFEFTGTGNWISFEFESDLKDNVSGEYVVECLYVTNYDFSSVVEKDVNWESIAIWGWKSGELKINKTGVDEYEISFTFTDDNDKTVTGYYKGKLNYYDHS